MPENYMDYDDASESREFAQLDRFPGRFPGPGFPGARNCQTFFQQGYRQGFRQGYRQGTRECRFRPYPGR